MVLDAIALLPTWLHTTLRTKPLKTWS